MDLNFQYAHNDFSESETESSVSSSRALKAFETFDWIGEAIKANELQKCSPTLTVIREKDKDMIWVSPFERDGTLTFISECYFPGEVSAWFGLSKKQGTVNLSSQNFRIKDAEKAISLFVQNNQAGLRQHYENA